MLVHNLYISLVRFGLRSGHILGKEQLPRLNICSLCILTICYLVNVRFGFEGGAGVLIEPIPCHCLLVTSIVRFRVTVVRLQA